MSPLSLTTTIFDDSRHIQQLFFINGNKHSFIIDTGSIESFISIFDLTSLCSNYVLKPTSITVKGITGHALSIFGSCELSLTNSDNKSHNCTFLVTKHGPSVIGLKSMKILQLTLALSTSAMESSLKSLILQCSNFTGGMKITPIRLDISGHPIFMKRRVISLGLREPVKKVLDNLLARGILTPVDSSAWATPIVTPLKRDGQTPRICGDYRITLNKVLLQTSCTTVEPEDILNEFYGSKFFSKIDLKDAYLQIPLNTTSSALTTINTPYGLFRYNFLPFGLNVSPAIFQNVMNEITAGIFGVSVYQDDVIIHAPTKALHDERLRMLLERFCLKHVAINPSKCTFSMSKFACLGYLIDETGFRPDPSRFSQLSNATSPTNFDELRSLLGSLQYYSRFIPTFSDKAESLFHLQSQQNFVWTNVHEQALRSLLTFLSTDAILRPFSPKLLSTVITDASPTGIGAVLEQDGHPVLCISRRLSSAERGYSQTQREALAVFWAVNRLHKYLFGLHFCIVSDHEALKFIYHPHQSLSKSSAAMVQRWAISLSAYNYTIQHKPANHIPHADYLSRYSSSDEVGDLDCLLVQPLPIGRQDLIADTRKYFGSIMSTITKGWNTIQKKKFPEFFKHREEISVTPDGILCLNDRVIIPPTLRSAVLDDLHSGHLGIEKMKSLARLTCWWPELNLDLNRVAKNCSQCHHKFITQPSKWTPWPVSHEVWQRIHADYCGPFIGNYYALIIIDSYSRWPEVYFTRTPNSDFTMQALRKTFSREGIPHVLVTDNGSHFAAHSVKEWLKGIGCKHLLTAPRHPQSNGAAENFVRTLKSAITSLNAKTFLELDRGVDHFLMQYRNAAHGTTHISPTTLFKKRILQTNMMCLESAEVIFHRGNDIRPSNGIILNKVGNRMYKLFDLFDGTVHNRHIDQLKFNNTDKIDTNNSHFESLPESTIEEQSEDVEPIPARRSERLRQLERKNYCKLDICLNPGGCGDCT